MQMIDQSKESREGNFCGPLIGQIVLHMIFFTANKLQTPQHGI